MITERYKRAITERNPLPIQANIQFANQMAFIQPAWRLAVDQQPLILPASTAIQDLNYVCIYLNYRSVFFDDRIKTEKVTAYKLIALNWKLIDAYLRKLRVFESPLNHFKSEHTSLRHNSDIAKGHSDVEDVSRQDTFLGKFADSKLLDVFFFVIYQHVHQVVIKYEYGLGVDLAWVENSGLLQFG